MLAFNFDLNPLNKIMYTTKTKPRKHNTSEIPFSQKFGALGFRLCDKSSRIN